MRFLLAFLTFQQAWAFIPGRENTEQPSCLQAREIIYWSANHYGGGKRIDLKSDAFVAKVAGSLFEKLDPRKLLFTDKEKKQLAKDHPSAWNAFLEKGECNFYEKWVSTAFFSAKERLLKSVDEIQGATKPNGDGLTKQVAMQIRLTLKETRPDVLKAYGGDKRAFVKDNLIQILAEESESLAERPRLLLAKAGLGAMDGFSTYLSSAESMDLHEDLSAGTTGVGVLLRKVPMGLFIENLVPNAPAAQSGKLKVGDIITSVDGMDVVALPFNESRKLFRGLPQSEIKLAILREKETQIVALSRAPFSFENSKIESSRASGNPGVLVVDIPSFYASSDPGMKTSSAEDLRKILLKEMLKKTQPAALVLDVRGNPGGYLEEAVEMTGLFVGERPVVSVVEHRGKRTLKDEGAIPLYKGPLVVLQDEESASAAEILAGALKDYQRALIVGTPASYGKGSVQRLYELSEEMALGITVPGVVKLTTSVFYTPLGHNPSNGGIGSDIVLAQGASSLEHTAGPPELQPVVESTLLAKIKTDRKKMDCVRAALKEMIAAREPADGKKADVLKDAVQVANGWVEYEKANRKEKKSLAE